MASQIRSPRFNSVPLFWATFFLAHSQTRSCAGGFRACRRLCRNLSTRFWLSSYTQFLYHKPVYLSKDFETHTFNVPVLCVDNFVQRITTYWNLVSQIRSRTLYFWTPACSIFGAAHLWASACTSGLLIVSSLLIIFSFKIWVSLKIRKFSFYSDLKSLTYAFAQNF